MSNRLKRLLDGYLGESACCVELSQEAWMKLTTVSRKEGVFHMAHSDRVLNSVGIDDKVFVIILSRYSALHMPIPHSVAYWADTVYDLKTRKYLKNRYKKIESN